MGILDELREQANEKLQEHRKETLNKEKLEHNYQIQILPKMQLLYSYFKELIDYLSVIELPVCVEHYSDRYKEIGKLYQQDYKLTTDQYGGLAHIDKLQEVNLKFYCMGDPDESPTFIHSVKSKVELDLEIDFLSSHKIAHEYDRYLGQMNSDLINLSISRKIPVFFKFQVEYDTSRIVLKMMNHENFELRTQFINPDQIDENYLDKLARYILRKDCEFLAVELDENYKAHLRQQIEAQKQANEEEFQAALSQEAKEQQQMEQQKISSKLKGIFSQILEK